MEDQRNFNTTKRKKPSCNEALGILSSDERFEPIWGPGGCINHSINVAAEDERGKYCTFNERSHNIRCSTFSFYRSADLLRKGEATEAARKCGAGLEGRHHHRPLRQQEIDYAKLRQASRVQIAAASSGRDASGNVNIRKIFDEEKEKFPSLAGIDSTALYNTMIGPLTKCAAKRKARQNEKTPLRRRRPEEQQQQQQESDDDDNDNRQANPPMPVQQEPPQQQQQQQHQHQQQQQRQQQQPYLIDTENEERVDQQYAAERGEALSRCIAASIAAGKTRRQREQQQKEQQHTSLQLTPVRPPRQLPHPPQHSHPLNPVRRKTRGGIIEQQQQTRLPHIPPPFRPWEDPPNRPTQQPQLQQHRGKGKSLRPAARKPFNNNNNNNSPTRRLAPGTEDDLFSPVATTSGVNGQQQRQQQWEQLQAEGAQQARDRARRAEHLKLRYVERIDVGPLWTREPLVPRSNSPFSAFSADQGTRADNFVVVVDAPPPVEAETEEGEVMETGEEPIARWIKDSTTEPTTERQQQLPPPAPALVEGREPTLGTSSLHQALRAATTEDIESWYVASFSLTRVLGRHLQHRLPNHPYPRPRLVDDSLSSSSGPSEPDLYDRLACATVFTNVIQRAGPQWGVENEGGSEPLGSPTLDRVLRESSTEDVVLWYNASIALSNIFGRHYHHRQPDDQHYSPPPQPPT